MQKNLEVRCLPPLIWEDSKILIMGSAPSAMSLEKNEFYGNPRNYLWRILFLLYGKPCPEAYDEKLAFLKEKKIALFDRIARCRREGSLDANIRGQENNDIEGFLEKHPTIRVVAINGAKAGEAFPGRDLTGIDIVRLPSTSPIPRKQYRNFDDVFRAWNKALSKYLEK